MKSLFILIAFFTFIAFTLQEEDISAEETQLMTKIINWRKEKNLNLGKNNQLERKLDDLSEKELDSLLKNIDDLGKFENFPTTVKSEKLADGEYLAEVIVKAAKSTDYPASIFKLWTEDEKIAKHLSYEYNQYGIACDIYGVTRICVLHLKQTKKAK